MSRKSRILEACPSVKNTFLHEELDNALIGFAERGGSDIKIPVYGYQAIKVLLKSKGLNPKQVYSLINSINNDKALILSRFAYKPLWSFIKSKKIPYWEDFTECILGLSNDSICYSRPLILQYLEYESTPMSDDSVQEYLRQNQFFEQNILCAALGKNPPYYITPIK